MTHYVTITNVPMLDMIFTVGQMHFNNNCLRFFFFFFLLKYDFVFMRNMNIC